MIASKICADCHTTKPLADFYTDARRRDGHGSYCKSCTIARNQHSRPAWLKNNPQKAAEQKRRSYKKQGNEGRKRRARRQRVWRQRTLWVEWLKNLDLRPSHETLLRMPLSVEQKEGLSNALADLKRGENK